MSFTLLEALTELFQNGTYLIVLDITYDDAAVLVVQFESDCWKNSFAALLLFSSFVFFSKIDD